MECELKLKPAQIIEIIKKKKNYVCRFPAEVILENVQRTNTIYGGFQPAVRNVYSTHGQLDPWRPMGLQEDLNEWSPTTILACMYMLQLVINKSP